MSTPKRVPPVFNRMSQNEFNVCSTIPPKAANAQKKLLEMNGKRDPSISLVGGWVHIYLHEDAVRSGLVELRVK